MSRSPTEARRQTTSALRAEIDADPRRRGVKMAIESGWCEIKLTADGVAVLELHRDHDLGTMDDVSAAFDDLAASERDVVLDLERTTFIDSAVVHAIYGFAVRQTDAGRRLVLHLGRESAVRRVLDVVGLLEHVPSADDLEDAIALLQDEPRRG
jgi:anti-anti-sigma factor